MIRSGSRGQLEFPDFYLPFSGHLDRGNRWIVLVKIVPWTLAAEIYAESLCDDFGAPALTARVALGALLIKEQLGLTDRETARISEAIALASLSQAPTSQASIPAANESDVAMPSEPADHHSDPPPADGYPPEGQETSATAESSTGTESSRNATPTTPPANRGKRIVDAASSMAILSMGVFTYSSIAAAIG